MTDFEKGGPEGDELVEWLLWLRERPKCIRDVVERVPPWRRYSLAPHGSVVHILAYGEHEDESVTLTVRVLKDPPRPFGQSFVPRDVFGINPDDLTALDPE